MARPVSSPPAGTDADRSAGVDPLATGRVDVRIDAVAGYGRTFDSSWGNPSTVPNALGAGPAP
jgi:hypothetical protein